MNPVLPWHHEAAINWIGMDAHPNIVAMLADTISRHDPAAAQEASRDSLAKGVAEALSSRGFWVPKDHASSDLISAVAQVAAQHEVTVRLLEEAFHMLNMTPRRPIHEPFHVELHKTNIALADKIRVHLRTLSSQRGEKGRK